MIGIMSPRDPYGALEWAGFCLVDSLFLLLLHFVLLFFDSGPPIHFVLVYKSKLRSAVQPGYRPPLPVTSLPPHWPPQLNGVFLFKIIYKALITTGSWIPIENRVLL